jgi:hypothetical protein
VVNRSSKIFAAVLGALAALAALLVLGALPAFCQMNTGEIDGTVRDPAGAVVANAAVEALETGTQLRYFAKTNSAGEYLLAGLPVGHYVVTVSMQGFKQIVQNNIELHAGERLREPFTLELGEQTETDSYKPNRPRSKTPSSNGK